MLFPQFDISWTKKGWDNLFRHEKIGASELRSLSFVFQKVLNNSQ